MKFALQRQSGYISPYSLAMIYPSYKRSEAFSERRGTYRSPILVQVGTTRWVKTWPWVLRFPSWVSRKVHNRDEMGQVKW